MDPAEANLRKFINMITLKVYDDSNECPTRTTMYDYIHKIKNFDGPSRYGTYSFMFEYEDRFEAYISIDERTYLLIKSNPFEFVFCHPLYLIDKCNKEDSLKSFKVFLSIITTRYEIIKIFNDKFFEYKVDLLPFEEDGQ